MIEEYLKTDNLRLMSPCNNWEEMIQATGEVMVNLDIVSPAYIDAMVSAKEKYGPYMVIVPGVALLHARPEDGVKKTGIVILTSDKDISFGSENDPVRVAIGFAATKQNDHLVILQDLACLLQNETAIEKISTFKNGEESDLFNFLVSLELQSEDCL